MMHTHLIDKVNTTKELAQLINREKAGAQFDVVNYASFDETLPFYTRQKVYIASYKGELEMGSTYPDTQQMFLSNEEFARLFKSDRKVLCVLKATRLGVCATWASRTCRSWLVRAGRCLVSNGK